MVHHNKLIFQTDLMVKTVITLLKLNLHMMKKLALQQLEFSPIIQMLEHMEFLHMKSSLVEMVMMGWVFPQSHQKIILITQLLLQSL